MRQRTHSPSETSETKITHEGSTRTQTGDRLRAQSSGPTAEAITSAEEQQQKTIELVSGLGETMDQLCIILQEEASDVHKRSSKELERFYREKTRLHAEYTAAMERVKQISNGEKLSLPDALRTKMQERAAALSASMRHNKITIGAAAEASSRVVNMIVAAVRQQRQGATGYALDLKGDLTGTPGTAQGVTIDQSL